LAAISRRAAVREVRGSNDEGAQRAQGLADRARVQAAHDICATWTLEGFEAHPDWRNDPRYRWRSDGNVLLKTLRTLQQELDESFQGRSGA